MPAPGRITRLRPSCPDERASRWRPGRGREHRAAASTVARARTRRAPTRRPVAGSCTSASTPTGGRRRSTRAPRGRGRRSPPRRPHGPREVAHVHRLLGVDRAAERALAVPVTASDVAGDRPTRPAEGFGPPAEHLAVAPSTASGTGCTPSTSSTVSNHGAMSSGSTPGIPLFVQAVSTSSGVRKHVPEFTTVEPPTTRPMGGR